MISPVVLVVEDSDEDYEVLKRAFKKAEFNADIKRCPDGQDAFNHLTVICLEEKLADIPSLILLDINMPKMNGKELLQTIKSHHKLKSIPVVIITSSTNQNEVNECYGNGANAYLTKMHQFNDFLESMKSLKQFWLETATLPTVAN